MSEPRKRPAYEPAARLLQPTTADPAMKRPAATLAGALLVLLRVAVGVAFLWELSQHWNDLASNLDDGIDGITLTADDRALGLTFVVAVGAAVLLVELLLAVLILLGRNLPRVIVMVFAVFSISGSFAAWWSEGQEITLRTSLVSLSVDILVLLALSSRSAAAYARRNERR